MDADGGVHLGSPLLALTSKSPFDNYFYADANADNIETLKTRCQSSGTGSRIAYFVGDSNELVDSIVVKIGSMEQGRVSGRWSWCLNLAFLDPFGLELEWNTVEALAGLRTDLIIHYSQMGLQRYMPIAVESEGQTIVDRFFGTRKWRSIFRENKSSLYGELMSMYKQNLIDLGYTDVKSEDEVCRIPMMRNTKNAPLYCLMFASKSDLGERFWREVTNRNLYGQQRLF